MQKVNIYNVEIWKKPSNHKLSRGAELHWRFSYIESHAFSGIQVFQSNLIAFMLVAPPPPPASLPSQSPQAAVLLSFLQPKLAPAAAVLVSHCH